MAKLLLLSLSLLSLAGCYQRPDYATSQPDSDPVWAKYHFHGDHGRPYVRDAFGHWGSVGRDITQADIDAAPCKVVISKGGRSCYDHDKRTIFIDRFAKYPVLLHESQHYIDRCNGITDSRTLEARAMVAEMGLSLP
jgi:hypothetical protein